MDNYNKEMEENLLEMVKQKEEADKRLLRTEIFVGAISAVVLFLLIGIAAYVEMEVWLRVTLIVVGFVLFIVGCFCALRIEQVAGYYECGECGHKYTPEFKSVTIAMHLGRTRYMKCPHCGKISWQKKVISKE